MERPLHGSFLHCRFEELKGENGKQKETFTERAPENVFEGVMHVEVWTYGMTLI